MVALLADIGRSRNKIGLALVAAAADTLLHMAVDPLVAGLIDDRQVVLRLLRNLGNLLLLLLLSLLSGRAELGIARTLLAALVLALGADLGGAVAGAAMVAGAMHAHANGLLHALHANRLGRGRDPFMRLQSESILGKQGAGTLLLESSAIERLGHGSGLGGFGLLLFGRCGTDTGQR
jgi:hypothetical protein